MAELVRPRALVPGGTIGVAAGSGPVDEARLEAGLARLRSKGYRVIEASNLRRRESFLAGSDAERAEGYRSLLRDPAVDAVFFARGGYGAARILPLLDPEELRRHPKIHLGGSDLTALFSWIAREAGLVVFYGPMVGVEMALDDEDKDELDWEPVLAGRRPEDQAFGSGDVLAPGRGEGPLVGGCLSLLASLAGTPDAARADGAIFFWEDVGEAAYRLDRMLLQLERAGTFGTLRGMVIGSVVPPAGETREALEAWLADHFRGAPFPVVRNLPSGHLPRPRTLPLGVRARLDGGGSPSLAILEPCVESR